MALADRDYMRNQPRGGGRGGGGGGPGQIFRMKRSVLSMTTWLIIINVAVFAIDRVITASGNAVATELGVATTASFQGDYADLEVPPNAPVQRSSRGYGLYERPMIDTNTGRVAAVQIITQMGFFESLGYFSTLRIRKLEVWRFVTFQFLHADGWHLAMNMIGLFFFGPLAERYLGSRRLFLAFYLMCGIAGALLYLLLNLAGAVLPFKLPLVLVNATWVPLVGASAGVFGVLWAAAHIRAHDIMLVMGIIPMKIRTGVYLFTGIALFNLLVGGGNAGGDAAHIGGAIAGAFFIRRPQLLLNFFDEILGTSGRHPAFNRGREKVTRGPAPPRRQTSHEKKLNAILDKVRNKGMGALSPREKRFLERESERRGGDG